ncbi:MAG: Glucitol operon repressor [bacterium ADurb.Bin429]|nr:MAG: Glucitol operon repressor [bacterium ADurb.Bin429]
MKASEQRLAAITHLLDETRQVDIRALAERFSVSTMTIRRDLASLEALGLLVRTFRGGIAAPDAAHPTRVDTSPVKRAIGQLAAALVTPGQTIIVDAGTTTLEVVRNLPRDAGLTLVTNSLPAAQEVRGSGMRIVLLGGYLSDDEVRIYGPMTEACLASLHADLLFVGCVGACGARGFYMSDLHLTSNVRAMMRATDRVVVTAESYKFRQPSLSCYAQPSEVAIVVTDDGLPTRDRALLEEQGVRVLTA